MTIKLVRFNQHGTGFRATAPEERFREFRVYAENGAVQVWAEMLLSRPTQNPEAMQYLTAEEAFRVGWGFIRSAAVARWHRR